MQLSTSCFMNEMTIGKKENRTQRTNELDISTLIGSEATSNQIKSLKLNYSIQTNLTILNES